LISEVRTKKKSESTAQPASRDVWRRKNLSGTGQELKGIFKNPTVKLKTKEGTTSKKGRKAAKRGKIMVQDEPRYRIKTGLVNTDPDAHYWEGNSKRKKM